MSANYLCFQGEFFREDQAFMKLNRAFKYADGCFESIRSIGHSIPLLERHLARLGETLSNLQIQADPSFFSEVRAALLETIKRNHFESGARLRLTVFRKGGGKYHSEENGAAYLIEAESREGPFQLNKKGLTLEVCETVKIYPNPHGAFKLIGSIPYIKAANEKANRKEDELLILNAEGQIAEATSSNIFIAKGKKIFTTPLASGCIDGVMRSFVIEQLAKMPYEVSIQKLKIEDLLDADEIFLTNAIAGVTWVSSFRNKRFFKRASQELLIELNNLLP